MKNVLAILTLTIVFVACNKEDEDYKLVPCPREISTRAFYFAKKYAESNTKYLWGGQDLLGADTIKIDCSGLIVNCYKYAIAGTEYSLLFDDANVLSIHQSSFMCTTPSKGDLIFFSNSKNDTPTHIGIVDTFMQNENYVYFIDATLKEDLNIDGVSARGYQIDDIDIHCYFGALNLRVTE